MAVQTPDFSEIATPPITRTELRGKSLGALLFVGGGGAHEAVEVCEAGGGGVVGVCEAGALFFGEDFEGGVGDGLDEDGALLEELFSSSG